jgi:RNA polymerase sigma-70 factor (ECF subfamily)
MLMASAAEREVIGRLIAGDESAFRGLFRLHSPLMFGVAMRMLSRNVADAEDAVQEAWVRALRGVSAFRGDSALGTWLVGITVRCALEVGRRRRRGDHEVFAPDHVRTTPAERVDLERAIAALAEGYRHVLVLHDIYGYTHAEIGRLLGVDEGTSKSQLSRARHLVRRTLADAVLSEESHK